MFDLKRLTASTYPLIGKPLPEALATLRAAGVTRCDLLGRMPHFSLKPEECDPAQWNRIATQAGVSIAHIASYVGNQFASADPLEQQEGLREVERAVDVAQALGARSIRVFRFNSPADNPALIPRLAPWLRRAAAYAQPKNIQLGIENHRGPLVGNPQHCLDLVRAVDAPNFGILFDPCNLLVQGVDYRAAYRLLQPHILHVHIKDGTSTINSQKTTMLGTGDLDVRWLLRALAEDGYTGDVMLEYEVENVPVDTGLQKWYTTFDQLASEV